MLEWVLNYGSQLPHTILRFSTYRILLEISKKKHLQDAKAFCDEQYKYF